MCSGTEGGAGNTAGDHPVPTMCQYERKQNDRSTGVSSNSAVQPAVDQSSNKMGLGQNQSKKLDNNYQILEMIKFAIFPTSNGTVRIMNISLV